MIGVAALPPTHLAVRAIDIVGCALDAAVRQLVLADATCLRCFYVEPPLGHR